MSTIYTFASDINAEYMSASIRFDRLSLFAEASLAEYNINCKEAQLKVLKESATADEYYSLLKEAEESFIDRAKNTIKKIIETVKQFIDKCKERIVKLITDLKSSKLIEKIRDAMDKNPEIKNETVDYTDTDSAVKTIDSGISKLNIKATKIGAVGASPGDSDEIKDIFEKVMQEVSVKIDVQSKMTLESATKYLERMNSETEVNNEMGGLPNNDPLNTMVGKVDDAPDSETAEAMSTAADCMGKAKKERFSLKTIKFTSILQGIRNCFSKIKSKISDAFNKDKDGEKETSDSTETKSEPVSAPAPETKPSEPEKTPEKKVEPKKKSILGIFNKKDKSSETSTTESVYDIPLFNQSFYYESYHHDTTSSKTLGMSEGLDLDAYFTEIYNSI